TSIWKKDDFYDPGIMERLAKEVEEIRYFRLKQELTVSSNPEINTDKESLVSRMEALGFRDRIAAAFTEAEKKLSAAATSLDFKGVMDLVRTAYEETFEDVAKHMANARNKTL